MSVISEFKDFINRGNVLDLAVGIVIGGAFGKLAGTLVDNVIMPPIGLILSGVNFKDLKIVLKEKMGDAPEVAISYGNFLQVTIEFLIIAFVIFLVVKAKNAASKKEEAAAPPPAPPAQEILLTEIRDLLKKQ